MFATACLWMAKESGAGAGAGPGSQAVVFSAGDVVKQHPLDNFSQVFNDVHAGKMKRCADLVQST